MEKRGRGQLVPKRRRLLTALLVALFLFPVSLGAVDIGVFVSTFELDPGQTLLVEFSIPDVSPADVTFSDSSLPPSFSTASGRKELRYAGAEAVTVISREWVPSKSGVFTIGPFSFVVRGEHVSVAPVRITVTSPRSGSATSLVWKTASGNETVTAGAETSGAVTGKAILISLAASFSGTAGTVSCPAPENALLEPVSLPVSPGTRLSASASEPVVVAVWRWTPLETGWQEFPAATFLITDENGTERTLESEPAGITVGHGASPVSAVRIPGSVARSFSDAPPTDAANAAGSANVADSANVAGSASASGGSNADTSNAETLARLRHVEYTSFFPASARRERLALEETLGLTSSLSVPPAAWKPVAVIGAVFFFSLAFVIRLVRRPSRHTLSRFRPATFSLFFVSLLLALLAVTLYTRDPGDAAVCRGAELYHVPESGSSVIDRLPEGFASRIERRVGEWAYVTTPDGMAGWIRSDAIIEYTTEN
jgi:hypothetical protein